MRMTPGPGACGENVSIPRRNGVHAMKKEEAAAPFEGPGTE